MLLKGITMEKKQTEDRMEKEEIEELIEKKILEAKLEVCEKRLQWFLAIGTALLISLGVIVPIWQTTISTKKVDTAIREMREEFKELAGIQLRKPDLECFVDGKNLENAVLDIMEGKESLFMLKNTGDAPASNIQIRLYMAADQRVRLGPTEYIWGPVNSDDIGFSKAFRLDHVWLDAGETFSFYIILYAEGEEIQVPAMFRFYYGQPKPKEIRFTMNVKQR